MSVLVQPDDYFQRKFALENGLWKSKLYLCFRVRIRSLKVVS